MIKVVGWLIGSMAVIYLVICLLFFFFQERFMFFPQKLPSNFQFTFPYEFEEFYIEVEEGIRLNGLLFKAGKEGNKPDPEQSNQNTNGLVFYLHGNAGALNSWGYAADEFLYEGYDVFILDYRGYGKSDGKISSQKQLFGDVEQAFMEIAKLYRGKDIIITGFSIGTGPASWLASRHQVDMLILIAPFYSMTELAKRYFPFLPSFMLGYPLRNYQNIGKVEAPVVLIHGREDEIIPYESSLKLKEDLGDDIVLYSLDGMGHNNISGSAQFRNVLKKVLNR